MKMSQRVRIIKFAERERQAEAQLAESMEPVTLNVHDNARRATATITGWIGDLRIQQKQDTARAHLQLMQANQLVRLPAKGRKRRKAR
jgi:hypothetical protein